MTGVNEIIEFLFDLVGVGVSIVLAGSVFPVDDIKINPEKIVRNLWQIKGIHNYTPNDLANTI